MKKIEKSDAGESGDSGDSCDPGKSGESSDFGESCGPGESCDSGESEKSWRCQWIVGVKSFQKIFGLYGLKGHRVKVKCHDCDGRTDGEDRVRILSTEFAIVKLCL